MPPLSSLQHRPNHINLQQHTREQSEVKDLRGWRLGQRKVVAATGVCRHRHTNGTKSYHHDACIKMCVQVVRFAFCKQRHIQPIQLPHSLAQVSALATSLENNMWRQALCSSSEQCWHFGRVWGGHPQHEHYKLQWSIHQRFSSNRRGGEAVGQHYMSWTQVNKKWRLYICHFCLQI